MNRLLTFVAIAAIPLLTGCINVSKTAENAPDAIAWPAQLASLSTIELEARRAAVKAEMAAIERDVEMKAGLHMGVLISDERGRLSDLYREANSIERELVRRTAYTRL